MPKVVEVGPLTFPSKKAAEDHYRAIRDAHKDGGMIPEPHATQLHWLLDRHPEAAEKRGAGVAGFRVRKAMGGTECFWVIRVDGTTTDISFRYCIDGKPPTAMKEMLQAMRAEVEESVRAFRRQFFLDHGGGDGRVNCAISGVPILPAECDVDHVPPKTFHALATAFLTERGIVPDRHHVTAPADNQYVPRLVDLALAADWRAYHDARAVLRILEKGVHLRQGAAAKGRGLEQKPGA